MRCSDCGGEIEAWFEEYIEKASGWYPKLCRSCHLRWALSTGTMAQKQDEWKYRLPVKRIWMRKSKTDGTHRSQ